MITCRTFVEFMMDYFSGELPQAQRENFDSHLAECPACVIYLKTYQETVALGKGACAEPDGPVPDDVPEELVRAILDARAKGE